MPARARVQRLRQFLRKAAGTGNEARPGPQAATESSLTVPGVYGYAYEYGWLGAKPGRGRGPEYSITHRTLYWFCPPQQHTTRTVAGHGRHSASIGMVLPARAPDAHAYALCPSTCASADSFESIALACFIGR
jgi:hypothetical protein